MTDWQSWRKHVDYVVATRGRWFGLGDGDGTPIMTLPDPTDIDAPDQWAEAEDLSFTMPALTRDYLTHPAAERLVMAGLGTFSRDGRLATATEDLTLLVAFPGPGGHVQRRGGVITHTDGIDQDNAGTPTEITINATSIMDAWKTTIAASWPAAWWKARPYERTEDEAGIAYSEPWALARVELATRSTFVWKHGPAGFVIRRLAQESLDATMATQADPDGTLWVDDPYCVVEVPEIDTSPEISLEARDDTLWDTVSNQARNAGIVLGARAWWPGDPPIRTWKPAKSTMTPAEVDITPTEGESQRPVGQHTFSHAMIVLTAKEVK